jgi:hypothetical protein
MALRLIRQTHGVVIAGDGHDMVAVNVGELARRRQLNHWMRTTRLGRDLAPYLQPRAPIIHVPPRRDREPRPRRTRRSRARSPGRLAEDDEPADITAGGAA